MPLRLPDLKNVNFRLLCARGELHIQDRSLVKALASKKPLEAKFSASGRTGFVQAGFTDRKSRQHLHVDVAAREFFATTPPKPTNKLSEVKALVEELFQQPIELDAKGVYSVSRDGLPEFIRSTIVETQASDVSLRTTGGSLAVRGAPVYGLWWWLEDDKTARIEFRARLKREIKESYLVDIYQVLDSAFSALVLGG